MRRPLWCSRRLPTPDSSVLVLPSLGREGTPRSLTQAQAMVASKGDGIPEVIEDGVGGVLVLPRGGRSLSESSCTALSSSLSP